MTVNIWNGRSKKVADFETIIDQLDCLLRAQANMKQDIRQIVREEIKNVLESRNRRGWAQIA